MNGPWSPDISWPTAALGKIAEVQLGKMLQPEPSTDVDVLTPYLRAGSLGKLESLGELPRMYASPRDRESYGVVPGDLVVAEGGDVGRPEFAPQVQGGTIIQNSLHRVRPLAGIAESRFVKYALEAIYSGEWLEVLCNRSTFGHLTLGKVRSLPVPLPPISHQCRIADYLDTETARIDALLAKKRQLREVVLERNLARQDQLALPKLATERRAPDDVPQLSEVPADWVIAPLGVLLKRITYGFTNPMPTTDEGPFMLTANDIGDGEIHWETARRTDEPSYEALTAKSRPAAGDILVTKDGSLGRVALFHGEVPVCVNQSVAVLTPDSSRVRPDLLAWLLGSRTYNSALVSNAGGTTIKHLYITRMIKQKLAFPPGQRDQEVLCREMERSHGVGAHLADRLDQSMSLLREHRQALIMAAVTGELEVPGVAA